jgi:hypothetical protein
VGSWGFVERAVSMFDLVTVRVFMAHLGYVCLMSGRSRGCTAFWLSMSCGG